MFYPVELLSRRRRSKLAPCWLAAMSSEKSFKRYYNSRAIKKMDTTEICNEILEVIQSRDGRSDRYSLYLSSQLICGLTKIHSYQTAYYQKEAFEFQQKLDSVASLKKKSDEFDIQNIEFPPIELPRSSQYFLDAQLGPDLHILPGEDLDDRLQIVMQDAACQNFGCLNDEELEFMLEPDNISFGLKKMLQIGEEIDISEKMADITIAEEVHGEKQLSQEILSPVLVDLSKRRDKFGKKLSLTPQKRQPHQIQVETPTKRRRLSFETAATTAPPALEEDVTVPTLELPAEEANMLVPQQTELDMKLEPLHSSYFVIDRRSKKGKFIDQRIALDDKQLWKWRQDVNSHCTKLDIPSIKRRTPAINLFKQPSHLLMGWSTRLRNRFADRITGPFTSVDEDVAPSALEEDVAVPALELPDAEPIRFQEVMRIEETFSRLNLPTKDLSTFAKTDTAIVAEPVDSIVNTVPITNIVHETGDVSVPPVPEVPLPDTITLQEGTSITFEGRQDQRKTPDINNIEESFEDIETLLEKQRRSSKIAHILESSAISTVGTSADTLMSHDILTMLEDLWCNEPCVKFSKLVPKDTYTREDAATIFSILLELHAEKKLVLQQTGCYRTLRIWKYEKS